MRGMREALNIASGRMRAQYGFACSMAMDTLNQLELSAARFADPAHAQVEGLRFDG